MRQPFFLSLILVLTLGWMQIYSRAREVFNGVSEYKAEIQRLRHQNEESRVELDLASEHFLEFRQSVAALMPDVLKEKGLGEEGYPYRSLASTISKRESEDVRKAIAKTLFETGKNYFRQKKYARANAAFKKVIAQFSYTPYVAESYFLMSEGYFQQHELEECVTIVQQMVELFPQHELTGFALIRLGRIYEIQNRNEEAVDIYKTVLRSYPQRDVASQAKSSLKGLEL